MDRFSIIIEKQSQLESIIKQLGFMPFFKNTIEGFSIEEMTPPELLFGDDMENGPWQWKGPIISNWQSAYGKFFRGKAGYVSLEWLPDFMNWRRTVYPIDKESEDSRRIFDVLVENESMLSKQLKIASGFSLSRKKTKFNPEDPTEPIVNKNKGEPYGWGVARYCTPEAMYPELFPIKDQVDGRTPEESRNRIIEHLCGLFPDVEKKKIEKLI